MGAHRYDDPDFWSAGPEALRPLQEVSAEHGLKIVHFLLGPGDDEATSAAAVLEMPPGYVLPRHAHDCERFEVIVRGSLRVGDATHRPGDVLTSAALEMYGPHVAGPEGCTTVEVFGSLRGVGHTIFDTDDGPNQVDYLAAPTDREGHP
jgi:hypothetical protein